MSMYTLLRNNPQPSEEEIELACESQSIITHNIALFTDTLVCISKEL